MDTNMTRFTFILALWMNVASALEGLRQLVNINGQQASWIIPHVTDRRSLASGRLWELAVHYLKPPPTT